jgi:hypothetical protein
MTHEISNGLPKCKAHEAIKATLWFYGVIASALFTAIFWVAMRNYADNKEKIEDTKSSISAIVEKVDKLTETVQELKVLIKIHMKEVKEEKKNE